MEKLKKNLRKIFYVLFILAFLWVSTQLFFEEQAHKIQVSVKSLFLSSENQDQKTDLKIVYPSVPTSLEPTYLDPTTRQRLVNIYEPLVKADRDLKLRPSLAISWGLIDNKTWEFYLRPNVKFHDGSNLDFEDILSSYNRAKNYDKSQLKGLLETIEKIEMIDEESFRIKTYNPDPLLLQRLSQLLIFPSEYEEYDELPVVGTGSYKLSEWDGDTIKIEKYPGYWGKNPKFQNVDLITRKNKNSRVQMLINGEADILSFVHYGFINELVDKGFKISTIPSLEVQFLVFNMHSQVTGDVNVRKAIYISMNQKKLVGKLGEYAKTVNQFISSGIFGFNPKIREFTYNTEEANKLIKKAGMQDATIQFHLPKGLDVLGEDVRKSLKNIGLSPVISYLDPDEFLSSIQNGKADIYFLGFRSEMGDSADFLNTIVHSDGEFNIGKYKNEKVDKLIESTKTDLDPVSRQKDLQEIMKIIVEDDVIGVPLFEYETVYAYNKNLQMDPRIDGLIYVDEITQTTQ